MWVPARVVCLHWCGFDINPYVTPAQIVISLVVDQMVMMMMVVMSVVMVMIVVVVV